MWMLLLVCHSGKVEMATPLRSTYNDFDKIISLLKVAIPIFLLVSKVSP